MDRTAANTSSTATLHSSLLTLHFNWQSSISYGCLRPRLRKLLCSALDA